MDNFMTEMGWLLLGWVALDCRMRVRDLSDELDRRERMLRELADVDLGGEGG